MAARKPIKKPSWATDRHYEEVEETLERTDSLFEDFGGDSEGLF